MPTLVSNTPSHHHVRKKTAMASPVESTGYTHSISPTNREEVSWSSSEGSTYYSEGSPSLQQESSDESTDHSDDEQSLQQRRQNHQVSQQKRYENEVSHYANSYDVKTDYQRSKDRKDRKETTPKDFRPRKDKRVLPPLSLERKKKLSLENVENFPAIQIATGSEDVSAVGFLTTKDTAEVFCKAGIPFEITANKKLYENISAMSSSSTSGSSAESSYSSDSDSDEENRRHQDKHVKHSATDTERATIRSQTSEVSTEESSVPTIDRHAVAAVSVSYQDPVSSMECASSWEDSSLSSDSSGGSSMEKPKIQKTRKSSVHTRETVTSHERNSKVGRVKEIKRKQSDCKTDERIRQLKAKIKSIQDLSTTNVTVSSSEVESHPSSTIQSQKTQVRKTFQYEDEDKVQDDNLHSTEPIMNRSKSRDPQMPYKSIPIQNDFRRSYEADKSLVGTMIPVVEREEISVLRFDTSSRPLGDGDIERGRLRTSKSEKLTSLKELRSSLSERTKVLITGVQYRAIAAYDHVVPIVARKRAEFLRKPRYEQILIVGIGALLSIFIVLLFVMIAQ